MPQAPGSSQAVWNRQVALNRCASSPTATSPSPTVHSPKPRSTSAASGSSSAPTWTKRWPGDAKPSPPAGFLSRCERSSKSGRIEKSLSQGSMPWFMSAASLACGLPELAPQIGKLHRAGSRPEMPIARRRPPRKFPIVPALPILKVQIIVSLLREKGRKPPRLPGQHAVIIRRGDDESRRVANIRRRNVLHRRIGAQVLVRDTVARITILSRPGGTWREFDEIQHVGQRSADDDGIHELGVALHDSCGHQATIGTTQDSCAARLSNPAAVQVLEDRSHVIVRQIPLVSHDSPMPLGRALAAAAKIGMHIDAPALQPELSKQRLVARRQRNVVSPVAINKGRRTVVELEVAAAGDAVCDQCAVGTARLVVLSKEIGRIEKCGLLIKGLLFSSILRINLHNSIRQERGLFTQQQLALREIHYLDVSSTRQRNGPRLPCACLARGQLNQPAGVVVQQFNKQASVAGSGAANRIIARGGIDHFD